jgi:PucR family transcriptional regulator, purine catabolism regulatory protein
MSAVTASSDLEPGAPSASPTVADVLELPEVELGRPQVLAGAEALGTPVRWVHVSELPDIATLLRGGELVLTTGVALPDSDPELARYVIELADAGAAGLVVELGRRFTGRLPAGMVRAARAQRLPLIALTREARFVRITEAVHVRIIEAQVASLRATTRVHEEFSRLAEDDAGVEEIVRAAARLADRPVVLENLAHQVLALEPGRAEVADLLVRWDHRSRASRPAGRSGYDPVRGWLINTVGARGTDWARLVLVCADEPTALDRLVAARAAAALGLTRPAGGQPGALEQDAHASLLSRLLGPGYLDAEELVTRAGALGVPLRNRIFVGAVIRPVRGAFADTSAATVAAWLRSGADAAASIARELRLAALASPVGGTDAVVLLSLPRTGAADPVVDRWAGLLRDRVGDGIGYVIAVGSVAAGPVEAARSLAEAHHVADAAEAQRGSGPCHRISDVGLRGLLALLRNDTSVQSFAERTVGPLLTHDGRHRTALVPALRAYFAAGGRKSAAAEIAHLSRPAFYERLDRIERVLGTDLSDPETALSLQVALLAHDILHET